MVIWPDAISAQNSRAAVSAPAPGALGLDAALELLVQADAGKRHPQRSEGADKLALPVAVAIALGRAVALLARAAAQRRLRFLLHQSLDEGADT